MNAYETHTDEARALEFRFLGAIGLNALIVVAEVVEIERRIS